MDAEERHGFEGDGFTYLKSPIWWAGIIARMRLLPSSKLDSANIVFSDYWRNCEFCGIRICACDSSNPSRGSECFNRCGARVIFPEGSAGHIGEAWMRHMPHRLSYHRFTCSA